jgi:hypothetical protein
MLFFRSYLILLYFATGAVSSVGLEHYLDRVGVTGSNPVQRTKRRAEKQSAERSFLSSSFSLSPPLSALFLTLLFSFALALFLALFNLIQESFSPVNNPKYRLNVQGISSNSG